MFTGNEASLTIPRIAIAMVGKIPVDARVSASPSKHSVIWDIAPKQIISIRKVHRPFGPKRSGVKPFNPSVSENQMKKSFIVNFKFVLYAGHPDHWFSLG
jgi:hypothetical protein